MPLSKKQIKTIARIHSAIHLSYINLEAFCGDNCTPEEADAICSEVNKIASKLLFNDPINMGSSDKIIKYVIDNY